jgi:hypothetical protein
MAELVVVGFDNPNDADRVLPPEIQSQVNLDSITFINNDRLEGAIARTTATQDQKVEALRVNTEALRVNTEALRVNTEARLRALKIGLLIMAGLALLTIMPASQLPNYRPGESPAE